MFIESINNGINLVHSNLQLIYIRIALIFINIAGFFVIVGLPAAAAVASFGIDAEHLDDLFMSIVQDPEGAVSAYVGFMLLILLSLFIYTAFASVLHLYVLSGTLGALKRSALKEGEVFSFSSFFSEARRYFFLLVGLISITSLIFLAVLIMFSILSGIGSEMGSLISGGGEFMKDFTDSFFMFSGVIFGGIILAAAFIFIIYSIVISVTSEDGVMDTIKRTSVFLMEKPSAFLFFIILSIGLLTVNAVFFFLHLPMNMLFDNTLLVSLIVVMINTVVQSYLMVVFWGCLIAFYVKASNYKVSRVTYDI